MDKEAREKQIKEIVEIIKLGGSYSIELDAYSVNPTTVACRLINAGYFRPDLSKLKPLSKCEIGMALKLHPTAPSFYQEWCKYEPAVTQQDEIISQDTVDSIKAELERQREGR